MSVSIVENQSATELSSGKFSLKAAYAFAEERGLTAEAAEISATKILKWELSYDSGVRRGRMIRLLKKHNLLDAFISEKWPTGLTKYGQTQIARFLSIADKYDAFLIRTGGVEGGESPDDAEEREYHEFALEAHLRDFVAKNLGSIEPGLKLYQTDDDNGIEYSIDNGRIDILALDRNGKFVVIELKLSHGRNKTLGQILYYMGWVDKNLGNAPCRGLIIASEISDELLIAVSRASDITLAKYKMTFSIEKIAA